MKRLIFALVSLCTDWAAAKSPLVPVKMPVNEKNAAFFKLFSRKLAGTAPEKVDPKLSFDREEKIR